jgi:hypothetical protein
MKWIRISEQLPDTDKEVLLFSDEYCSPKFETGFLSDDKAHWSLSNEHEEGVDEFQFWTYYTEPRELKM